MRTRIDQGVDRTARDVKNLQCSPAFLWQVETDVRGGRNRIRIAAVKDDGSGKIVRCLVQGSARTDEYRVTRLGIGRRIVHPTVFDDFVYCKDEPPFWILDPVRFNADDAIGPRGC
jgi:hypothetical protein